MRFVVLSIMAGSFLANFEPVWAWQEGFKPEDQITVITDVFCQKDECFGPPGERPTHGNGPFTPEEWHMAITDAVDQWNEMGSYLQIKTRRMRADEDVCALSDLTVLIILTNKEFIESLCLGDPAGIANLLSPTSGAIATKPPLFDFPRIYVTMESGGLPHLRRLLVHEIGHQIGLAHPDDAGQDVRAIMNGDLGCNLEGEEFIYCDTVQPDDIEGIYALWGGGYQPKILVGFLENPSDESFQSGIGFISGWVCDAENVEISIWSEQGGWVEQKTAIYGIERGDTEAVCGDKNNGFGLQFNWNLQGDGKYIVDVLVDGELLDRSHVDVTTLGVEFLRGVTGEYILSDFPAKGQSVVVEWNEALQNFVITEWR